MLQPIRGVRQDGTGRERHWFQDDYFDLFAWTDAAGEVVAFQLCYDRLNNERVLAWSATAGFSHRRIDDGEELPTQNLSPIMVADGWFATSHVCAEFAARSAAIDRRLREFIGMKIAQAPASLSAPAGTA
jgi:hypothetical protein